MKTFKEIRNINESPEDLGKMLDKKPNRKEYEKAIEMMLGGDSADKAAKKFKGVDAKELKKMFGAMNESVELTEKTYKASIDDKDYQAIRKASMRGKFVHKFTRTGETVSFSTNRPNLLVKDLEKLIDSGASSWSEILDINESLDESKDPCWDGYAQIGTKMKNGKEVPNCVPIAKESLDEAKSYSYKEADEYFEYIAGANYRFKRETAWWDGHWVDTDSGEMLKAKESKKPAAAKMYKESLDEAIDKSSPIYKEYQNLKTKSKGDLVKMWKSGQSMNIAPDFGGKEDVIMTLLHDRHGRTRMKKVFGESGEESKQLTFADIREAVNKKASAGQITSILNGLSFKLSQGKAQKPSVDAGSVWADYQNKELVDYDGNWTSATNRKMVKKMVDQAFKSYNNKVELSSESKGMISIIVDL